MVIHYKYPKIIFINFILLLFNLFSYLCYNDNIVFITYVQAIMILSSVILMVYHFYKLYGAIINFHTVIILGYYVFFLSRQFTALFGYKSYLSSRYGVNFEYKDYSFAFFYSYVCVFAFYIFSIVSYSPEIQIISDDKIEIKLYRALKLVLFFCLLPMIYYYYKLISSSLVFAYGSDAYDTLISSSGYIIGIMHRWGLLALIGIVTLKYIGKVEVSIFYVLLYFMFSTLALFSGGRTEGMSLLLVIVLLFSERFRGNRKIQILSVVGILFIAILAPYLFEIRKDITQINNIKFSDYTNGNSILDALHEMGGSIMPFLYIKNLNSWIFGKSYLNAFLNTIVNFLPGRIRPVFEPTSLAYYFTISLGLNAGLGFNLIAEAYYNFGYFGFLVFAIFGYIFKRIVSNSNSSTDFIKNVMLVFLLFTMARRESKDLFTAILYCWIPFAFLISYIKNKYSDKQIIQSN